MVYQTYTAPEIFLKYSAVSIIFHNSYLPAPVEKLLDVSQVHLLGTVKQISDGQKESDYIIVCSQYENIAGMHWFGQVRLLRFDLFRLMNEISPEATYQQIKNKKEVTTAAGVVCGMSYEQKGICYERLARDIMCLLGPSQDRYI